MQPPQSPSNCNGCGGTGKVTIHLPTGKGVKIDCPKCKGKGTKTK